MITIGYTNRGACIVRALVAIGLGAMMISLNNFTSALVNIIATVLAVLGIISLVYGILNKDGQYRWFSQIGSIIVLAIAVLMFLWPEAMAKALVFLVCIGIALAALLEIVMFGSVLRFGGFGRLGFIVSLVLFVGGVALLFSDAGMRITRIIAGVLAVLYGVNVLINLPRMRRFIIDSQPSPPSADIEEQ